MLKLSGNIGRFGRVNDPESPVRGSERSHSMKHSPILVFIVLAAVLAACSTGPKKLDPVPLTEEEIEFLKKLDDPETFSLVQDVPELFQTLGNLNEAWVDAFLTKDSPKQFRVYTNLGEILTRRVYANFETILDQLHKGPPPNKIIAAMSLGFSRIPENEKFPQVYPKAIEALVGVLDSGNDAIVKNALLGLFVLGDPETPLDTILDIMVQHHDSDVRANAALAVQAIATPEMAEKILPYVLPGLKDDKAIVRVHCILIAIKLQDDSLTTALVEQLYDQPPLIQAGVARALGNLNDISLCEYLIPLTQSRYPIVREYALKSLRTLSGKDYGFDMDDWNDWWEKTKKDK